MPIIYSYPHATPTINDMVLGTRFRENEGISTNSFYIHELINLMDTTTVVYTLATALNTTTLNALYPNAMIGFKVQGINPSLLKIYEKSSSTTWITYPITIV
jgi:hypothetical protein